MGPSASYVREDNTWILEGNGKLLLQKPFVFFLIDGYGENVEILYHL